MSRRRRDEAMAEIATRRRAVEDRMAAVRAALSSETGLAPDRRGWRIALLAAAAGLAVALRRRARPASLPGSADDGDDELL